MAGEVSNPKQIPPVSRKLAQLFHIECLNRGVATASRGDVFASLAAEQNHFDALAEAVMQFCDTYEGLLRRSVAGR